jgi:hypothetical protein
MAARAILSHISAMRKLPVVLLCRTISVLPKRPYQRHIASHPASTRGTFRPIVTTRGAGSGGRNRRARRSAREASDKAVWSRHPDAGVKPRVK